MLGDVLYYEGTYGEAAAAWQAAQAIYEHKLGAEHPAVAQMMNDLAIVARLHGDLARSLEELLQRSLALELAARGPDHWLVAARHGELLATPTARSATSTARRRSFERARARGSPPRSARQRRSRRRRWWSLGDLAAARGHLDDAAAAYERAIAVDGAAEGDHHPDTEQARAKASARCACARAAPMKAVALCEPATTPALPSPGVRLPRRRASALAGADLTRETPCGRGGDRDTRTAAVPAEASIDTALVRYALARATWSAGDRAKALALARAAAEDLARAGGVEARDASAWIAAHPP